MRSPREPQTEKQFAQCVNMWHLWYLRFSHLAPSQQWLATISQA